MDETSCAPTYFRRLATLQSVFLAACASQKTTSLERIRVSGCVGFRGREREPTEVHSNTSVPKSPS